MGTAIEDFTHTLLAHQGALVEPGDGGLSVMVPPELAATLALPEYQRLVFDPQVDEGQGLRVDYDSPLLDRLGGIVGGFGRAAWLQAAPMPLKHIDAEHAIELALTITNGVVRNCRAEPAESIYVCYFVEYDLLADEKVAGAFELWVNATTRSLPRLEGWLSPTTAAGAPPSPVGPASESLGGIVRRAWPLAAPTARALTLRRLDEPIESLRRRRERELVRLREYHQGIDEEVRRRARRALARHDADAANAEASRLEATASTYRARVADLVERYRVRVRLRPLGALACPLVVPHVTATLHRRSASREMRFAWNPVQRGIEAPCCEACGLATSSVTLCDDRVHLLCTSCAAACATCGRPFCRACHAACPRSHA